MLQKFESNLSFKLDGNSVNLMNSVHRSCYMAGDRLRRSRRVPGGLGFTLAQGRCRRGFLELLSRSIRPRRCRRRSFLLLCFSGRHRSTPASPCRRRSASPASAKLSTAPLAPYALSRTILDACLHRETAVHAFLPRGRQPYRRERVAVASALRSASDLEKLCFSFISMPWFLTSC